MSPQNSQVEILTPSVTVFRGEDLLGGDLSHEAEAVTNGVSDLIKEATQSSLTSFHHGRTDRSPPSMKWEADPQQALNLPAF